MKTELLAFTEQGFSLAQRLAQALDGRAQRCTPPLTLAAWTAQAFSAADALVFVGAVGIAVRAIAPYVRSKAQDPAVVVVDECARFAVPVLSGHLGGANDLARRITQICGAVPVITTATDLHRAFAVDEWAKRQGCTVADPGRIKLVSAKILRGETVLFRSPWPVSGEVPGGVQEGAPCDFELTVCAKDSGALRIVPHIAVLGFGCRRGVSVQVIENVFSSFLRESSLSEEAFVKVCSIDLKADEPGLCEFCRAHGLALETFSAEELRQAEGEFSPSAFVKSVTGVDNVCERSAVLGSKGALFQRKYVKNGVTMAAALAPFAPDWRWYDE